MDSHVRVAHDFRTTHLLKKGPDVPIPWNNPYFPGYLQGHRRFGPYTGSIYLASPTPFMVVGWRIVQTQQKHVPPEYWSSCLALTCMLRTWDAPYVYVQMCKSEFRPGVLNFVRNCSHRS